MNYIVVTGTSKGLGLSIAEEILADDKYGVIGISRTISVENECLKSKYSDRYIHIKYNLMEPAGIKELYNSELKKYKNITGLVNNAAIAYDDIATNANLNMLEDMFKINYFSPVMLTKYILRHFLLHKIKGSLVFVSSVSTKTGYKGLSMYASTKGALEAYSLNVAREWGSIGIRSNCVVPGFMETYMSSSLDADKKDRIYKRTALKKPTSPESVAGLIKFLLSDKAESVTGESIRIDNGTL